jgi:hypothetical protein
MQIVPKGDFAILIAGINAFAHETKKPRCSHRGYGDCVLSCDELMSVFTAFATCRASRLSYCELVQQARGRRCSICSLFRWLPPVSVRHRWPAPNQVCELHSRPDCDVRRRLALSCRFRSPEAKADCRSYVRRPQFERSRYGRCCAREPTLRTCSGCDPDTRLRTVRLCE